MTPAYPFLFKTIFHFCNSDISVCCVLNLFGERKGRVTRNDQYYENTPPSHPQTQNLVRDPPFSAMDVHSCLPPQPLFQNDVLQSL